MSNLNGHVQLLFERLWQPTHKPGVVSKVERPLDARRNETAALSSYKPRDVTRRGMPIVRFRLKTESEFVQELLDRFQLTESKTNLTGIKGILKGNKINSLKDKFTGIARKLDDTNNKVNDWMDSPTNY